MKYYIEIYNDKLKYWQKTGLSFKKKEDAIKEVDRLFFVAQSKKSYRIVERIKIVAERLFIHTN